MAEGKDSKVSPLLKRTRNTVTFHYDRAEFANGIGSLLQRYGAEARTTLLARLEGPAVRMYYPTADHIRTNVAFTLDGGGGMRPELAVATDLLEHLKTFVDSLFYAYGTNRGLKGLFREVAESNVSM